MLNNGGSSSLRATHNVNNNLSHQGPIEDIDESEPQPHLTGQSGDEVVMPSHKTKDNEFRNVTYKSALTLPDFSDDYLTVVEGVDESILNTATPIGDHFLTPWDDAAESDLKTTAPIETSLTLEQKAIEDEKRQDNKDRRQSKTTPDEKAKKKELKRQEKAERDLKKSEMTPMKTRDKPVKINNVFITSNMLIDELNKHNDVLKEIKKDKVKGINTMTKSKLQELFTKYMGEEAQQYFNSGKHEN